MFEYDYIIKRHEGDTEVTYLPDKFPTQLPNLVYIEGPNSSGKSTLLNIVAIGLWGQKRSDMNPALKHKMKSLMDTSYQQLGFTFKIQSKDKSIEIIAQKSADKKSFKVYELINGKKKPIDKDRFEREYNLIYDIPDNPTQRLNQLTSTIKDLQSLRYRNIVRFRSHIQDVIEAVKSSRDPKRIQIIKDDIKKVKKEQKAQSENIEFKTKHLELLEKFTYSKFYIDYDRKYLDINSEIKKLKRSRKSTKRKMTKQNQDYEVYYKLVQNEKEIIENEFYQILPIIKSLMTKDYKEFITMLDRINISNIFTDMEIPESFTSVLLKIKNILTTKKEKDSVSQHVQEAQMWAKVIEILEDYKAKEFIVPSTGKNLSEFITILRNANESNEYTLTQFDNIDHVCQSIDVIYESSTKLESIIFIRLRDLTETDGLVLMDDQLTFENNLSEKEDKKDLLENSLTYYINKCDSVGIKPEDVNIVYNNLSLNEELSTYLILSEDEILDSIEKIKEEININKESITRKNLYIEHKTTEQERLERKEPHQYQEKIDDLQKILKICQSVENKLVVFDRYITNIIKKKQSKKSTQDELDYYDEVSKYLGKRIGFLRHVNQEYTITSINMLKEKIYTKEGKIIRFADMGTGQSQSAYLMGQLNVNDNRKIIALFDEIAMMDQKSLTPIFRKLKDLYNENKLLLGIVVQMRQEANWEDLSR